MFIPKSEELHEVHADYERSHDAKWRKLGADMVLVSGHLGKQELGGGWAVEVGNSEDGGCRFSLTKNGKQAAVFDENRDVLGNNIFPTAHIHPFIDRHVALEKLQLAVEVGMSWDKDPFAESEPAPEPAPTL